MEFLYRSGVGDVPLVAFGGSDGVIRVLSMMTWKVCSLETLVIKRIIILNDVVVLCSLYVGTWEVTKDQSLA